MIDSSPDLFVWFVRCASFAVFTIIYNLRKSTTARPSRSAAALVSDRYLEN
jgi:hypothetical protein